VIPVAEHDDLLELAVLIADPLSTFDDGS